MGKEYILDILKENKTYNDTVLSLWSGSADYQDCLASAMLIMGYDLRQNIDDLTMLELGQNEYNTNGVIQLHGKDQSLVLWYSSGFVFPILVTKNEDELEFVLYSHKNLDLISYLAEHDSSELLNANEDVFNELVSLASSEKSHLATKFTVKNYIISSSFLFTALVDIMDDSANMTTNIGLSLTDIYELLNSGSSNHVYLPVGDKEVNEKGVTVIHHLPKVEYSKNQTSYAIYKDFIHTLVGVFNNNYSDGTRIILSDDIKNVEVYDNKGLSYLVPVLEPTDDFEHYDIVLTHAEFSKQLEHIVSVAKRANELYARLGDLDGTEFTNAELLPGKVKLSFKKVDWDKNKEVHGAIYFSMGTLDYKNIGVVKVNNPSTYEPKYITTFQTVLKGSSAKLKIGDSGAITLPSQPMSFDKTEYYFSLDELAEDLKEGIHLMLSADLKGLLGGYSLLVKEEG